MMRSVLLAGAGLVGSAVAGSVACSASAPTSCANTTAYNTCCLNAPGGHLLQTQFWDTDPVTGPSNSWTIHGLWPDNCDGTYQENCDSSRDYTDISSLLSSKAPDTLAYMNNLWKNDDGSDEELWEHEWATHGTCISTLDVDCYTDYYTGEEAVDFFNKVVELFQGLPTYEWLAAAGITPSSSKTYTSAEIQSAIESQYGYQVTIDCSDDELNQIYYHYVVQGSVQSGTFIPTSPVGSSTCPSKGIKYLPKSGDTSSVTYTATTSVGKSHSTSTSVVATTTTSGSGTSPTGVVLSGNGYLDVIVDGQQNGCVISYGTWYTTGTCATFEAAASGNGFTLSSSKGDCAVQSGQLTCSSSVNVQTIFTSDGTYLYYDGSKNFYADETPTGDTQATVSTSGGSVEFVIEWQAR